MQSDAELVNECLRGRKNAFAILVGRYRKPVRAAAVNVVGDYHLAADISQEAFVKAYEKLCTLRKPESFGPWLMKITRRCAIDLLKQKPAPQPLNETIAAEAQSPNSNGQLDEQKRALLTAVMKLPENERQVIMLRYFAGNSVKDVAKIADRGIGTVTKQLSRAHKKLRKILKEA